MGARIDNVPGFDGDVFSVNFPESIGPTEGSRWYDVIRCSWKEQEDGTRKAVCPRTFCRTRGLFRNWFTL